MKLSGYARIAAVSATLLLSGCTLRVGNIVFETDNNRKPRVYVEDPAPTDCDALATSDFYKRRF